MSPLSSPFLRKLIPFLVLSCFKYEARIQPWNCFSLRASSRNSPCQHLDFALLAFSTETEYISVGLSQGALGTQYADFQGPHHTDVQAGLDLPVCCLSSESSHEPAERPQGLPESCLRRRGRPRGLPRYCSTLFLNCAGLSPSPRKASC